MKSWRIGEGSRQNNIVATFEDPTAHNRMDEELQKQRHELNKRVKELNCLYAISNLAREQDISLEKRTDTADRRGCGRSPRTHC